MGYDVITINIFPTYIHAIYAFVYIIYVGCRTKALEIIPFIIYAEYNRLYFASTSTLGYRV